MNGTDGDSLPVQRGREYAEIAPYGGYGYPVSDTDEGAIDMRRLLSALRDKLWLIVLVMILGGVGGWMYSREQPVTYRTSASVYLDAPNPQTGPLQPGSVMAASGWAQVFTSNAVMEPVVRQFGLAAVRVSPPGPRSILDGLTLEDEYEPGRYQVQLTGDGGYRLLGADGTVLEEGRLSEGIGHTRGFDWVPTPEQIDQLARLEEDLVFGLRRPEQAAQGLSSRLAVRFDPMATLIHSEFVWPDPVEAAAIHNGILDSFRETAVRLAHGRVREEVEILEEQTASAEGQLASAEMALQRFSVDAITQPGQAQLTPPAGGTAGAGGAAGASAGGSSPQFSSYFQQSADLSQIESDLAELDAILTNRDGGQLNVLRLRLVPSIQSSPNIGATINRLDQLELDRRTALYTYTPNHPTVVALSDEIADIHQTQLPALIGELQTQLRNRKAVLENQLERQRGELQEIPVRTIEQTRLQRQARLAEGLVTTLRSRLNSARLAEQTATSNVRELDPAFVPGGPQPRTLPQFFVLIGSLAGLALAVGGILVRDRLDSRIRHPDDISQKFGLPLLGVVPQLKSPKSDRGTAAVAIESFRSIRTQLAHAGPPASGNGSSRGSRVLITSSTPREGKSVVAANLAISYASAGLRTLLVDADIRRGRLHTVFDLPRAPGLTEYLAGRTALQDVVRHDASASLEVITTGALSSDAELIGRKGLDAFLEDVGKMYDVVVIDGPPLAAGADALILGERCDQVVMVFRAGATSQEMARTRLSMLGNVDLPIVGAVLNAVPEHAPYYDRYVNYYYYAEAEAP